MLLFAAHNKSIETGQDLDEYLALDDIYRRLLIYMHRSRKETLRTGTLL